MHTRRAELPLLTVVASSVRAAPPELEQIAVTWMLSSEMPRLLAMLAAACSARATVLPVFE